MCVYVELYLCVLLEKKKKKEKRKFQINYLQYTQKLEQQFLKTQKEKQQIQIVWL